MFKPKLFTGEYISLRTSQTSLVTLNAQASNITARTALTALSAADETAHPRGQVTYLSKTDFRCVAREYRQGAHADFFRVNRGTLSAYYTFWTERYGVTRVKRVTRQAWLDGVRANTAHRVHGQGIVVNLR